MKIRIEFDTDNAAFEDNPLEIRDVLEQASNKAASLMISGSGKLGLRDSNGNTVGTVEVEK